MIGGSTLGAIHHLGKMTKRITFWVQLITQLVYISYIVYSIIGGVGIFGLNIGIGVLSVAYLVYFLIAEYRISRMTKKEKKSEVKTSKKVKSIYGKIKFAIKTINFGILMYSLWATATVATAFSTIITTLLVIVWVIEFVMILGEIAINYIVNLISEAIEDDKKAIVDTVTTPLRVVKKVGKSWLKRMFGFGSQEEEVEEEKYIRDERFIKMEHEYKADKAIEKEREKAKK